MKRAKSFKKRDAAEDLFEIILPIAQNFDLIILV